MTFIGGAVKKRMDLCRINEIQLAEMIFQHVSDVQAIIQDKKSLEEIDAFDLALLGSALHCPVEYFQGVNTGDFYSDKFFIYRLSCSYHFVSK